MKRFNVIALSLLVVTGNAVAMESKASQALTKRAINAVVANKGTIAKVAIPTAAVASLLYLLKKSREGKDNRPGTIMAEIHFEIQKHLKKTLAATAVTGGFLGYVYGNSVVTGAQKVGQVAGKYGIKAAAFSLQKAINLCEYLRKTGILAKAGNGIAKAKNVVAAHPRIAAAAAVATVATPVVIAKRGAIVDAASKAVAAVKARFAKKTEAPKADVTQAEQVEDTKAE